MKFLPCVLTLFGLLLPASPRASVTRGPYLQMSSPSAISVRWRTDVSELGRVRWGAAPGSLGTQLDETGPSKTEHELRITGLTASTRYYYDIGNTSGVSYAGGDSLHHFNTHPPTGQTGAYRFWVIGDPGTGTASQTAVRDRFYSLTTTSGVDADLWLQLGDNAYSSGTDAEFQANNFNIYQSLYRYCVTMPCIGNHEGTGTGYYPAYTLPTAAEMGGTASGTEAYYSFDYGDIHFIVLDSQNSSRLVGGAMYNWAQSDIQSTLLPWVIVYWHHPPYTKGSHNSDTESQLIDMRQNFLPMLESNGVDLILSGHSHSYERSYFIDGHYGLSTSFNPALKPTGNVVQAGDGKIGSGGAYLKYPGAGSGAVYAVAGASGQISGGSLNHAAMVVSLNVLGSMILDVNGSNLDAVMLDNLGNTRDAFRIQKATLSPTPTFTLSFTKTFTDSPTVTPSITETLTTSPTKTPTLTPTRTMTRTDSPTRTVTQTHTPSHSRTPTPTRSPSTTLTSTRTSSATPGLASPTDSPTTTATFTQTSTPSITSSQTPVYSPSSTPAQSPTATFTSTDVPTPGPTAIPAPQDSDKIFPQPAYGDQAELLYNLPEAGRMEILIWDLSGALVGVFRESQSAGFHRYRISLQGLSQGIYLYRLDYYLAGSVQRGGLKKFALLR